MQRPNELKRQAILKAARTAFTRRPFHEVKLDEVATAAKVGKGTIYVYFPSKDQLYLELVRDAADELLDELRRIGDAVDAGTEPAWNGVEACVKKVVEWTVRHPKMFDLMRAGIHPAGASAMRKRRGEMGQLIGRVLERAVAQGAIHDPRPELTANYIPAMARSGVVWGPGSITADELSSHILKLLGSGVQG